MVLTEIIDGVIMEVKKKKAKVVDLNFSTNKNLTISR